MKLILASFLFLTACGTQISTERAVQRAEQDRINHEQYLEEKYNDEHLCNVLGCEAIYNEKGQLIDVN